VTATAPVKARNPWIATSIVIVGTVLVVLDTTIVSVSLSRIALDLHVGTGIEWVATGYLLAVCASQPVTGWMADRFGRKHVFVVALSCFVLASIGCSASRSLGELVTFRVLQGLGGGAVTPIATAMVLELFPKERHGRAMAVATMALMMTPAIGPTVGGLIVSRTSWHWLFLVNVPIGTLTVIGAAMVVPEFGHRENRRLDVGGFVLGTGGLALLVLGLAQGNGWGWGSATTWAVLLGGLATLALFTVHELRTPLPMVDVRIFAHPSYAVSAMAIFFVSLAQFGRSVFIPLELESLRGFSPLKVGLLFIVPALFGMTGTWVGGRLVDTIGPRIPVMCGCTASFLGLIGLSHLSLTSSLPWIVVLLLFQSSGMGLAATPATVAGLSTLPPNLVAQGSALRSLTGQASGAFAIAIFGAVVATSAGPHPTAIGSQHAYNAAFAWAMIGAVISFGFATRLPRRVATAREVGGAAMPLID
jgi:EmrB/QacA subfamily drug resistance transporter